MRMRACHMYVRGCRRMHAYDNGPVHLQFYGDARVDAHVDVYARSYMRVYTCLRVSALRVSLHSCQYAACQCAYTCVMRNVFGDMRVHACKLRRERASDNCVFVVLARARAGVGE